MDHTPAFGQGGVIDGDAYQVVVGVVAPFLGQPGVVGGREGAGCDGGVEVGHGLEGSGVAFRSVPVLPGSLFDAVRPFLPVIGGGEGSAALDGK